MDDRFEQPGWSPPPVAPPVAQPVAPPPRRGRRAGAIAGLLGLGVAAGMVLALSWNANASSTTRTVRPPSPS